jgi:hypothetical protein
MNLLKETLEMLSTHKKLPEDVQWVGSDDGKYAVDWHAFEAMADIEYSNGYGGQEIVGDLVVVGPDWWLARHEYDGAEWWEFRSLPRWSTAPQLFCAVKRIGYECDLASLQEEWEKRHPAPSVEGKPEKESLDPEGEGWEWPTK